MINKACLILNGDFNAKHQYTSANTRNGPLNHHWQYEHYTRKSARPIPFNSGKKHQQNLLPCYFMSQLHFRMGKVQVLLMA